MIEVEIQGLKEMADTLQELDKKLRKKTLVKALRAAAAPMRKDAKKRAKRTTSAYRRYMSSGQGEGKTYYTKAGKKRRVATNRAKRGEGKYVMQPAGILKKSIHSYQLTKKTPKPHEAAVAIGVKLKGKTGETAFYWHMVEYGTVFHEARPFLRPAFVSNQEKAVEIFKERMAQEIEKITTPN